MKVWKCEECGFDPCFFVDADIDTVGSYPHKDSCCGIIDSEGFETNWVDSTWEEMGKYKGDSDGN